MTFDSQMVLPSQAPRPARPFFQALLFVLIAIGTVMAAESLALRLGQAGFVALRYEKTVFFAIANSALLLVSGIMLSTMDRRSFRTLGLWFYPRWVQEAFLGVGIGAGLIAAVTAALMAGRWLVYSGVYPIIAPAGFLRIGGFLLLAAACEELVFRGYAFQRMVDSLGAFGAVALSSAVFGLLHLSNPSPTVLSTANTMLAGVVLSAAYLKTRGLWMPIGLHWGWNLFLGPVFSLPISGFQMEPMLLRSHVAGPGWLTGAAYGPEGSIILTGVCIAAIVWLARTRRISPSPAMAEVLK